MAMNGYMYSTKAGVFRIVRANNGWKCWFEDECFDGPFESPQGAAEDVANGHTAWPSCGDPAALGISDDLGDWSIILDSR